MKTIYKIGNIFFETKDDLEVYKRANNTRQLEKLTEILTTIPPGSLDTDGNCICSKGCDSAAARCPQTTLQKDLWKLVGAQLQEVEEIIVYENSGEVLL